MKCIYCDNELEKSSSKSNGYHYCVRCKHTPAFKFNSDESYKTVEFFVTGPNALCYNIFIEFDAKRTFILGPTDRYAVPAQKDILVIFKYILNINPNTLEQKLKTILTFL